MQRTWNPRYLLASAGRWLLGVLVVLPLGIVVGLVLLMLWCLWMLACGLQVLTMSLSATGAGPANRRPPYSPAADRPANRGPSSVATRSALLPAPRRIATRPAAAGAARRSVSVEDVRRSLTDMAQQRWRKAKVMEALSRLGADWAWSTEVEPSADTVLRAGNMRLAAARERVHLRYRPGATLISRYTHPAVRIDVWFDGAGQLVHANAWRNGRM